MTVARAIVLAVVVVAVGSVTDLSPESALFGVTTDPALVRAIEALSSLLKTKSKC